MSNPKIEIPDDKFHPIFSNLFQVATNKAGEFIITFAYNEPATPDIPQKSVAIERIAMSKTGAQKLANLLQMALNRQQPPSSDSEFPRR